MCDHLSPGSGGGAGPPSCLINSSRSGWSLIRLQSASWKLAELDRLNQVLAKNLCLESSIDQPAGGDVVDVVLGEEGVPDSGNDQLKVQSRA